MNTIKFEEFTIKELQQRSYKKWAKVVKENPPFEFNSSVLIEKKKEYEDAIDKQKSHLEPLRKSLINDFSELLSAEPSLRDECIDILKKNLYSSYSDGHKRKVEFLTRVINSQSTESNEHILFALKYSVENAFQLHQVMSKYQIEVKSINQLLSDIRQGIVNENGAGSNADKLSVASNWMDAFMRKMTKAEVPTSDEIKNLFNEVYPGFKYEFDMSSLKTPKFAKGKLIKTSIAEALRFIFLEKHPDAGDITGDAIIRRYNKMGYW